MPPLFKMKLEVNKALLEKLRALPEKAQRNLRRKLVTELGPDVKQQVDNLLKPPPGPVSVPFMFGSINSMLFYIILVRQHPELLDGAIPVTNPRTGQTRYIGGHWKRTGEISGSFVVKVSDRIRGNLITVSNTHPKSKFVFGPWMVAGHRNTGYASQVDVSRQLLVEYVGERVKVMWKAAWQEAKRGEG